MEIMTAEFHLPGFKGHQVSTGLAGGSCHSLRPAELTRDYHLPLTPDRAPLTALGFGSGLLGPPQAPLVHPAWLGPYTNVTVLALC